jgi:hypothetical protein
VSDESIPNTLSVPLPELISLAVERWRLAGALDELPSGAGSLARHALRKMEDFLRGCELEARTMDGQVFDAGLAVQVVDSVDDPRLPGGTHLIDETLSPLVLWKGRVVKSAQVVTRRGTLR